MTSLEQAIRDAVEKGGWISGSAFPNDFEYWNGGDNARALLSPAFWQALGKARGWDRYFSKMPIIGAHGKPEIADELTWVYQWHRFINHLAAGKDIESFFAGL